MTQECARLPKPQVARLVLPDGSIHLVGVKAAADWLGVSATHLSLVCRGSHARGRRLLSRVREEFPELLGEAQ